MKVEGPFNIILDYYPNRAWRRWDVRLISHLEGRSRDYRCFTFTGALLRRRRLRAQCERAMRLLRKA